MSDKIEHFGFADPAAAREHAQGRNLWMKASRAHLGDERILAAAEIDGFMDAFSRSLRLVPEGHGGSSARRQKAKGKSRQGKNVQRPRLHGEMLHAEADPGQARKHHPQQLPEASAKPNQHADKRAKARRVTKRDLRLAKAAFASLEAKLKGAGREAEGSRHQARNGHPGIPHSYDEARLCPPSQGASSTNAIHHPQVALNVRSTCSCPCCGSSILLVIDINIVSGPDAHRSNGDGQ